MSVDVTITRNEVAVTTTPTVVTVTVAPTQISVLPVLGISDHAALTNLTTGDPHTQYQRLYNVKAYGALGDGTTNDTTAIQAAIDAVPSTGGVVYFPAGVYVVNGTLTVQDKENIVLRGVGAEHDALYSGSLTKGTVLKRVSGTGTLLTVGATGSSSQSVSNVGVEELAINGNNLAATGLLITSVYGGRFRGLHLCNCTTVALDVTTVDLSNVEDTQACLFERITIRQIESASGIGLRIGSGSAGLGNTSHNHFADVFVYHKNGAGYALGDCDSNRFEGLNTNRDGAGAAIGVDLGASNHASSGHCRGNVFLFLNPGAGGVTARATGFSKPSQNNVIWCYSRENSAPLPAIEAGASLFFTADRGLSSPALRPDFRVGAYCKDDFQAGNNSTTTVGELSWLQSGGTFSHLTTVANHPGILRMDTSASSGTIAFIRLGAAADTSVIASDLFDCMFVVRLNTNDTDTAVRFGISNNVGANPPSTGIYIEKAEADTSWFGVARTSGTQTRTSALASVSTSWVRLRVRRVNSTTIAFSVDDGTESTVTTNVPTVACSAFVHIRNNAAASKTVDVDYFEMVVSGITR